MDQKGQRQRRVRLRSARQKTASAGSVDGLEEELGHHLGECRRRSQTCKGQRHLRGGADARWSRTHPGLLPDEKPRGRWGHFQA